MFQKETLSTITQSHFGIGAQSYCDTAADNPTVFEANEIREDPEYSKITSKNNACLMALQVH